MTYEQVQKIMFEAKDQALKFEQRRLSGIKRLQSFSLFARLFKYKRFNRIRKIIENRADNRSGQTMIMMHCMRECKRYRKVMKTQ